MGSEVTDSVLELAQPEAFALVDKILSETQVVHGAVPLQLEKFNRPLCNLIVVDDLLACDFLNRQAPAIALPTQLGYTTQLSDLHTPNTPKQDGNHPTLLQLFIRGNPFRGSAGMTQVAQAWVERLLSSGNLQALVIYGSPYVLDQFLPALSPQVPCIFSYGQMRAAQAIALQTLFQFKSPLS